MLSLGKIILRGSPSRRRWVLYSRTHLITFSSPTGQGWCNSFLPCLQTRTLKFVTAESKHETAQDQIFISDFNKASPCKIFLKIPVLQNGIHQLKGGYVPQRWLYNIQTSQARFGFLQFPNNFFHIQLQ